MANDSILSNVEKEFMVNALGLGLRVDGRKLDTVREMKVEFGAQTGTVQVSLGKTRVLCRVTHELAAPRGDKPNQGSITINCTFPKYYQDSISNDEIDRICLMIKSGLYESKAIDLESLCVLSGRKAWLLTCNISVIQHDGNIIDCANLATLCALKHHRRPDVTVVGSKITVHSMLDRHPISLSISHLPICVTLAHVLIEQDAKGQPVQSSKENKDGFYTLIDPNLKEEKLMNGKTVYCMTKYKQLCAIDKIGGVPLMAKSFLGFINEFVLEVVKKWSHQIENKFIQHQYQSNDALARKNKLFKQVVNPIDVLGLEVTESKQEKRVSQIAGDVAMRSESEPGVVDEDQMWNEWEQQEKLKLQTIQTGLSEKRVSVTKSVLISEFDD